MVWCLFEVSPDGDQLLSLHQTADGAKTWAEEHSDWLKGQALTWEEQPDVYGGGWLSVLHGSLVHRLQQVPVLRLP